MISNITIYLVRYKFSISKALIYVLEGTSSSEEKLYVCNLLFSVPRSQCSNFGAPIIYLVQLCREVSTAALISLV